jgi:hypothetical protein
MVGMRDCWSEVEFVSISGLIGLARNSIAAFWRWKFLSRIRIIFGLRMKAFGERGVPRESMQQSVLKPSRGRRTGSRARCCVLASVGSSRLSGVRSPSMRRVAGRLRCSCGPAIDRDVTPRRTTWVSWGAKAEGQLSGGDPMALRTHSRQSRESAR